MSETLKPCPFCPELVACPDRDLGGWIIVCDREAGGCGASTAIYHREAEAIAAWNRRAPSPHGQDVEALVLRIVVDAIEACAVEEGFGAYRNSDWSVPITQIVARGVAALRSRTAGEGKP